MEDLANLLQGWMAIPVLATEEMHKAFVSASGVSLDVEHFRAAMKAVIDARPEDWKAFQPPAYCCHLDFVQKTRIMELEKQLGITA
jgi:hypothetical protein